MVLTTELQDLQKRVPIVSDKALVDLVNGIQVNQDSIHFRQNRGFIGRLFDSFTGSDRDRQMLIDNNLTVGMQSLHEWVMALSSNTHISNVALEITQAKLLETRNVIRTHRQELDLLNQLADNFQTRLEHHEQRIQSLEQRIYRTEVIQQIDFTIGAWKARRLVD